MRHISQNTNYKKYGDEYMSMGASLERMRIFLVLSILPLLPAIVFSTALGSVNHGDFIRLDPGQAGEFRMSFFNFGNNDIKVKAEVEEKPLNWTVSFYPGPVVILPGGQKTKTPGISPGDGWFRLSSGYYVPTYSIRVRITAANAVYAGDYTVKIIAYTEVVSGKGGATTGISTGQVVSQGRVFAFTVRINRDGTFYIPYNPIIPVTPQSGNKVTIGNETIIQPTAFGNIMENYVTGFVSESSKESESLGNIIRVDGGGATEKKGTSTKTTMAKKTSLEEFEKTIGTTPTGMITSKTSSHIAIKIIIVLIVLYIVIRWIRS
ncbi:MAG: hypothetical protein B6U68_01375 [Candidatus Aenigmarchaeota archaeon ex4484_14]|nr:MAG: hypothetical protein B6U68_01375 [Candidatus Aenigmarchaeota archaeon ex4484_14]